MSSRRTRRLERRSERQARDYGGNAPRAARSRASRTPVKVGSRGGFNMMPVLIGSAAFLLAALIVWLVVQANKTSPSTTDEVNQAQLDDSASLPGKFIPPHPGLDGQPNTGDERAHITENLAICTPELIAANDISHCYTSNPPTSGPHNPQPAQFKIWENPAPRGSLLHSMEHGGVVVWYNTSNQETINQLKSVVQDELNRGRLVVMTQYSEMEADTIALTAWTRLDKFPISDLTKNRVQVFIEKHNKRFNPEGF